VRLADLRLVVPAILGTTLLVAAPAALSTVSARLSASEQQPTGPIQTSRDGSATAERILVLDAAARTVSSFDPTTGLLSSAGYGPESVPRDGPFSTRFPIMFVGKPDPHRGSPTELLFSATTSRLVVLDHGPGESTIRFGWHPSRRSRLVVMHTPSLQPLAAIDGVWGLPVLFRFLEDGKQLTVVGPGYQSQRPEESRPPELVTVDLVSGKELVRVNLTDILSPTTTWEDWLASTALSRDGRYLYSLDRGKPSDDRARQRDGRVLVLSTVTGAQVTTLAAGSRPRAFVVDDEDDRVLLLSDNSDAPRRSGSTGALRVFRGAQAIAVTAVPSDSAFLRVSAAGNIFVFEPSGLTVVDGKDYVARRTISIQKAAASLATVPLAASPHDAALLATATSWPDFPVGAVSDAAISPDEQRAYVLHASSSQLSIVDLAAGVVAKKLTTGRPWKKVRMMMTITAANTASHVAAAQRARMFGGTQLYVLSRLLPAQTTLLMRPDGQMVFVMNSQTRDVTVVNAATSRVVRHIPADGLGIAVVTSKDLLITERDSKTRLVDLRTFKEIDSLALAGQPSDVAVSTTGDRILLLSGGKLLVIDAASRKVVSTSSDFLNPTRLVVDPTAGARAAEFLPPARDVFELRTPEGVLPGTRWMVMHVHRAAFCHGWLYIARDRIGFRSETEPEHRWEAAFKEVSDIGANRAIAGGGRYGSFHVSFASGTNYNFSLDGVSADPVLKPLRAALAQNK
jgi:DNA-binding beta-propeller fold protein YncE